MREVIVLRHANAEPLTAGVEDHERALSARGHAEAEAAGKWLHGQGKRPDRILCSPAKRTRETLERVLETLGYAEVRYEPRIYNASPGGLISLLDEHADAGRVLLVGHNPGCEQLVALLNEGRSGDFRGMPTAGVAVLQFPVGAAIEPGVGALSAFWWP